MNNLIKFVSKHKWFASGGHWFLLFFGFLLVYRGSWFTQWSLQSFVGVFVFFGNWGEHFLKGAVKIFVKDFEGNWVFWDVL